MHIGYSSFMFQSSNAVITTTVVPAGLLYKCVYDPYLLVWWYCAECIITIWVVSVRYVSAMQQYGLDLVLLYTMPALFDVLPLDEISTILHKSPDVLLDLVCVHRITLSTLVQSLH